MISNYILFESRNSFDKERYLKIYDKIKESAHDRTHILTVYNFAMILGKKYLPDKLHLVEAASILHDIGLIKKNRKTHHTDGEKYVKHDAYLKTIFSPSEIDQIAYAVKEHRATFGNPRTILAKIISDADRADTKYSLYRSWLYQKNNFNVTDDEALNMACTHIIKKFKGESYGRRYYFPETKKLLEGSFNPIICACEKNDKKTLNQILKTQKSLREK